MICEKCGKKTNQVYFEDLTDLGYKRVLCADCKKIGVVFEETADSYQGTKTVVLDLNEVIHQINPDIVCDFCGRPDPMWVYDLKVEPIKVSGDRMADLGDRWTACDGCSKDAEEHSALGTVLRTGITGDVTVMMSIHQYVMDGLSNKRAYVRSEKDGVIGLK